jgi:hypothetical protein
MSNHKVFSGDRGKRIAILVPTLIPVLLIAACGGNTSNPNATMSNVQNRAFISNTFSGNLQIVNTQNDTTGFTAETTNSAGQVVPGQPVTIAVSTTATFEAIGPNRAQTVVYNPTSKTLYVVNNSSESLSHTLPLANTASMAVFSPDSSKVYVPEPSAVLTTGSTPGAVQAWDSTGGNTANYPVTAANSVAVSPNGQFLLVFSNNSDSVVVIDTTASPVTYTTVTGFARPVNAFFSSGNSTTAYVINCGPECGSSGPASVAQLDISSHSIVKTVSVGGASVGFLNGTTLYVAGSPVPPGTMSTYDAVNVSNMTRTTANSVAIGDGFHTTMALAPNSKLYIGANSCLNTTTGCLSVVDVSSNTADPPLPPRGVITSLLSISNRNVMYTVEGGLLHIYDTTNNTLQSTQIIFTGALYGIVQVDAQP